ncbi:tRNA methyltransferase 11 homolog (Saccharomyces cerevisiae) [Seminavis robusta]|uniref:tRNA methyltransferase 11 homolog (Saccharomyces cerevisiae) n=1 Tax=Seminavis robusta TaxID=568900 RepID=A0A9N8DUN2_9STRA|nr:tRNA methyltransferase 11 homolog (Saccharomyces cerevisiae) [Seminavis robusta]|eukprot:Sro303_g112470.1 tRNA methyltransferase 11 homolog (Saccharomyces cerevisiae) (802) ;mRNA; f:58525-61183
MTSFAPISSTDSMRRNRIAAQQHEPVILASTGTIVTDLPDSEYPRPLQIGDYSQRSQSQQSAYYYETTTTTYSYRGGFSTSLCDLFQDPRDRSSCCALTCCGTFLQDRNRFILTGEMPPPWWMRILVHVGGFVLSVIVSSILVALFFNNQHSLLAALLPPVLFVMAMLLRGTTMRQQLRKQLQIRMMETTNPQSHNNDNHQSSSFSQQLHLSTRSEHWCCALVSNDRRRTLAHPNNTTTAMSRTQRDQHYFLQEERQRRQQADFCFRIWQLLSCLCCDICCFSWCHWCGMCATGQEDRELRRLLPPQVFWRDYITFQPYGEYYPQIEWLRQQQQQHTTTTTFWNHLGALSQLSQKLLSLLQCSILLLLGIATFHIISSFSIGKVFVVVATLAQAFLILYLVYWRHHRMDVSLDAIIKFFASGFVLAMTAALVVELLLDAIGEVIFSIVMTNEYIQDHPEVLTMDDDYAIAHGQVGPFSNIETFKGMAQKHYITLLVYLFFKAVVVAALVEEMTKYYCFWMVEHPDYIYGSLRHVNPEMGEEGAFCNHPADNNNNHGTTTNTNTNTTTSQQQQQCVVAPPTSPSESATTGMPPFRPRQTPNHTTAGAAITVGMIATAAGFACSENLMYVFSQNSVAGEITVLMVRSALPVHSICAAIQSIGVVRRDVEQDTDYKIGWAIFPAVLLHGMFDFILLSLSMMEYVWSPSSSSSTNNNSQGGDNNSQHSNAGAHDDWLGTNDDEYPAPVEYSETFAEQMLSFSVGAAITMIGVIYYVNESGKQRHRLQALEMTTAEVPSTAGLVFT